MIEHVRTIALGEAKVSILNVGDALVRLADDMNVPENVWRPRYADVFAQAQLFPSQCIHVALPWASVLVDAGDYALSYPPGSPYLPPHYTPPPQLIAQLASVGVSPEDVTHLVITHAHFDHYSGITLQRDGAYVPAFSNARCYLRRADWEHPETQGALAGADSPESRTLGALRHLGLLALVEEDIELTPGVQLLATPGESPGHQVVRISSSGQILYCLGDLYHHPIEVEHPSWMANWADTEANLASRNALVERALAENALLIAAHIAPLGRLERAQQTSSTVQWAAIS